MYIFTDMHILYIIFFLLTSALKLLKICDSCEIVSVDSLFSNKQLSILVRHWSCRLRSTTPETSVFERDVIRSKLCVIVNPLQARRWSIFHSSIKTINSSTKPFSRSMAFFMLDVKFVSIRFKESTYIVKRLNMKDLRCYKVLILPFLSMIVVSYSNSF